MSSTSTPPDRLDIPGPLEELVKEYSTWHQSRVQTAAWKEDCTEACDVMIKHGIDLKQGHACYNRPSSCQNFDCIYRNECVRIVLCTVALGGGETKWEVTV
jgi:hypothetical protein